MNQAILKEMLSYDPETGVFTWLQGTSRSPTGSVAGGVSEQGYRRIRIFGKKYRAHRLAWLYMTGEWPTVVDHKNGIRDDNRWVNLRKASVTDNTRNTGITPRNTSGVKGVSWHKRTSGWEAGVRVSGRYLRRQFQPSTHGGIEQAKKAAEAWVIETRSRAHGEFANHG